MSHNEGDNLRRTVHGLLATLPRDAELVVVDDVSSDASAEILADSYPTVRVVRPATRLGVAAARNYGARRSSGRIVVFSDAHVDVPTGWFDAFADVLEDPAVGAAAPAATGMDRGACGYGRTWVDAALTERWLPRRSDSPYPVPLLSGLFLAFRRDVFETTGGFDDGCIEWGSEDAEISVRLWTLGYRCMLVPSVRVAHLFRTAFPYSLSAEAPTHNRLRMASVHLSRERVARVVDELRSRPSFPAAVARFVESDAVRRRADVQARRRYDDSWFCEHFGIDAFHRTREESGQ